MTALCDRNTAHSQKKTKKKQVHYQKEKCQRGNNYLYSELI